MKKSNLLSSILMIALILSGLTIVSCSNDDATGDMTPEDDEVALSFSLDGTPYEAVFTTNSIFLAASDAAVTVLSASGALASGQNYAFAASFNGTGPGTYTLTQGAGELDDDISGLSVAIIDGSNTVTYVASNVTLTVSSYEVVSLAQIIVKGTFSGTIENEETEEVSNITNGSFVTGFIN